MQLRSASRALRSGPLLISTLTSDDELYAVVRNGYHAMTGLWVDRTPPSLDQIDDVAERLAADNDALRALLRRSVRVEVAHARRHGNLHPGDEPDWAHFDEAHAIWGDGTIVAPYSNVRLVRDPAPGRLVLVHSQARDAKHARIQHRQRRSGADGKGAPGIGFLTLGTWTVHGPIVLAVDMALGAELPVLRPMVDDVLAEAADGVHTLLYDRVVRPGWFMDYLMALHRVNVVNKAVARPLRPGEHSARRWFEEAARQEAHRRMRRPLTTQELKVAADRLALQELQQGHLPPGVSIYPTTGGVEVIDSAWSLLTERHVVNGEGHIDRFILDDEALFLEAADGSKGDLCSAISSTPMLTPSGTWGRRTRWRVGCTYGEWTLERIWVPSPRQGPGRNPASAGQRRVAYMRPLPRASAEFPGRRSTAESWNATLKGSQTHRGRANHLTPNLQLLDLFGIGQVTNALTWQRHPDAWHPWRSGL
jgi:hypothetical protein